MYYKAEFFSRSFDFKLFSVIDEPEVIFDYLTLDKTSVVLPGVADVKRGWYCHITRGAAVIYQGIVSGVDTGKNVTTVQLAPLISLFDFEFFYNRKTYNNSKTDAEGWMRSAILGAFAGSDSVQNIPGLTVHASTHTDGVDFNLKDNIHSFWDLARKAIENYKIAISCEFDPMNKTITAVIKNFSAVSEVTLEADLANVTEQKFTLRDDWGSVNKVIIHNADNLSQSEIFYASGYAAPVIQRVAEVTVSDGETFHNIAREKAAELMRKADADNLIELTFREGDAVIPDIRIGQPARILKGGKEYHSVLTGVTRKIAESGGSVTLVFGGVRVNLTQVLKLKGAI